MQHEILTPSLEAVGEQISQELGAKMVKDFQDQFPNESKWSFIGVNILNEIMAQPDCVGIRFYNALNEQNEKTLVYVGVNSKNEVIAEYTTLDLDGRLENRQGIVADRIGKPKSRDEETATTTASWVSLL